jgi:23S rRNA (guanine2445-N2)-methyltransferase / 23S rRNA (guanine2069-N7)-methyltransferase
MSKDLSLFASCPRGLEDLLLQELQAMGLDSARAVSAGVEFSADLSTAYRVCLWSRLASRVLLQLGEYDVASEDDLYRAVSSVNWSAHLNESGTLAVSCHLSNSQLNNSHYAALKAKDAIVDQFNELFGCRPSVDRETPDIRINLHIHRDRLSLALDLSGDPLHKRGYRQVSVSAPMKENLAAAILMRSGWPNESRTLVDLMCGSGTLLIEAAMMALNIAPGLQRSYWGMSRWKGHDAQAWQALLDEAEQIRNQVLSEQPALCIKGFDGAGKSVQAARSNIEFAQLATFIQVNQRRVEDCTDPGTEQPGLVIVNPPYGERLGEIKELAFLYAELGDCWKHHFGDWQAALFTGNIELAKHVGLRAHRDNTFYNGPIKCKLFQYGIRGAKPVDKEQRRAQEAEARAIIANRLKKNFKHLSRWAAKNQVECYRVYDADIPEYAAAIDCYGDWVLVQEYQAPASVDIRKVRQRLQNILDVIPEVLGADADHIVLKTRTQQKGLNQYEKLDNQRNIQVVHEGGLKFYVNLYDYLDTGLFLDHRVTREYIRDQVRGKRFLNLFAYTGSVSVYAAAGGAESIVTVDMSNTYLDWAKRNFAVNGFKSDHYQFLRADCLQWLEKTAQQPDRFDVIFLDPPTFSNSKSMEQSFDVQKDHTLLIHAAMNRLSDDGVLIFSNNFRKFKMNPSILDDYQVQDITAKTIPEDFRRNPKIHHCWEIRKR